MSSLHDKEFVCEHFGLTLRNTALYCLYYILSHNKLMLYWFRISYAYIEYFFCHIMSLITDYAPVAAWSPLFLLFLCISLFFVCCLYCFIWTVCPCTYLGRPFGNVFLNNLFTNLIWVFISNYELINMHFVGASSETYI